MTRGKTLVRQAVWPLTIRAFLEFARYKGRRTGSCDIDEHSLGFRNKPLGWLIASGCRHDRGVMRKNRRLPQIIAPIFGATL